jgi:hypothetical protein
MAWGRPQKSTPRGPIAFLTNAKVFEIRCGYAKRGKVSKTDNPPQCRPENVLTLDHRVRGIDVKESLRAIAAGSALLASCVTAMAAADRPTYDLKGFPTIEYHPILDVSGPCRADLDAWDTAVEFVTNQSTKLKLIKHIDHEGLSKLHKGDKLFQWAPLLMLLMETIDVGSGCAAVIRAEVTVTLQPTTIRGTEEGVSYPNYPVWSKTFKLNAPYQSFSKLVIETSEQMMTSFVNDWTKSQELPKF